MIWLTFLVIPVVLGIVWAFIPMKIPREPGREGPQEGEAVTAYDRTSRWPVFTIERSVVLHEIAKENPRGVMLDIGCGPGFLAAAVSRRFKDNRIIGLDLNQQMIDIAGKRWPEASYNNLVFLRGDAQQLPFADSTLDFVFSSLSLHHWKETDKVFREIKRVLKPGGRLIIFDLRRDGPHYFYYALALGQALAAPRAIKETNGAVGSFWSSYTSEELSGIMEGISFRHWKIDKRFAWLLLRGEAGEK